MNFNKTDNVRNNKPEMKYTLEEHFLFKSNIISYKYINNYSSRSTTYYKHIYIILKL